MYRGCESQQTDTSPSGTIGIKGGGLPAPHLSLQTLVTLALALMFFDQRSAGTNDRWKGQK